MPKANDMELLGSYHRHGSEAAFAELVQRHIALVHSVALRHVGIAAHAEEITQAVFVILARKAGELRPDTILEGWLYETARLASLSFLRGERRRQSREQEAYMQSTLQEPADNSVWQQLAPLLDQAMARLGKKDRDAVILRFFKDQSVREVAAAMQVNEAAAQRRILRAVGKLHKYFVQRGIDSATATIAGAISANSIQAAPAALAKTVTAVALAKGATAPISTLTLIKGALKIMAWTKAKAALAVGVGVLLAVGTTTVTVKEIQAHRTYSWQNLPASGNELDEVPPQVRIVPSKYSAFGECSRNGKVLGLGTSARYLLAAAYGVAPAHVVFSAGVPAGTFDFIANLPGHNQEALQQAVKRKFGLVGQTEIRTTDALLLEVKDATKLQAHAFKGQSDFKVERGLQYGDEPLSSVAAGVELLFEKPVVDATGRTGDYHLQFLADEFTGNEVKWSAVEARIESLRQTLENELNQDGLELMPTNMPIKMLVVGKAK